MAVNEISNAFVKTYEANVLHLVQQKTSKLRRTVTEKSPGPTISHSFRVVSARGAMTARTGVGTVAGKRTATPYSDTVFNDRICGSTPLGTADSFSHAEALRLITEPQSVLTQAQALQTGRQFDDTIVAALFASAADNAGNANAFPAANQLGGVAVAPSFSLVAQVRESALEADIDPDEEMFFVCSPNFAVALLSDAKATSIDYANARALMGGSIVQGWMGFTWIPTNRLTKPVAGPPAQVYGAAYTKDAIGMLVLQDVKVDVGQNPAAWFDTTIQTSIDIGCVRIQDAKVFRVHYLETN